VVLLCVAGSSNAGAPQTVERDLSYGPDPLQRVDLSVPIRFNGSTFRSRPRSNSPRCSSFMVAASRAAIRRTGITEACARRFVAAGIGCANVNYRLAPAASWPAPAEDVAGYNYYGVKGNADGIQDSTLG
jgi:hypothetical protein